MKDSIKQFEKKITNLQAIRAEIIEKKDLKLLALITGENEDAFSDGCGVVERETDEESLEAGFMLEMQDRLFNENGMPLSHYSLIA